MELAKIRVSSVHAVPICLKEIPRGIIGATVRFEYADPLWEGLRKTVVFRGCVTKDVLNTGEVVTIPPEVVAKAGQHLYVGVYGTDADENQAIPTLWADLGKIRAAADPSGDTSTDESLPVWAQLEEDIADLRENCTGGGDGNSKDTFVVQENEPEDTSVLWVDTSDNNDDDFQAAVNIALAQAKASGKFDGQPGKDGADGKDGYTPVKGIDYFDGADGKDGADYSLTDDDKTEIAEMASKLVEVPESSGGGIAVTGATVGQTVRISAVDENGVPTAWEAVNFPSGGSGSAGEEWEMVARITATEIVNSIYASFDACKAVRVQLVFAAVEDNLGNIGITVNAGETPYLGEYRTCAAGVTTSNSVKRGIIDAEIDTRATFYWTATSAITTRSDGAYGEIEVKDNKSLFNGEIGFKDVQYSFIQPHYLTENNNLENGIISVAAYGAGMNKGTTLFVWGLKK